MNKVALLIGPDQWDQKVIEDLDALGYSLIAVNEEDPMGLQSLFKHPKLKENIIYQDPYIYKQQLYISYAKKQISKFSQVIKDKKVSLIVPTHSINDMIYLVVAFLNQTFGLPGLNRKQSRFWYKKSRYLKHFKLLGINVPHIFQIVPMRNILIFIPLKDSLLFANQMVEQEEMGCI